ncbi:MAG: DNA resolvase [Alphaproteobacteria bacterium]|nr:MAG: DNA resolvase [Alphaproteobacteria bacterium]
MLTLKKEKTEISHNTGKKIGYVRVSDTDQSENLQIDALKQAGCDVIYGDHGVSGSIKKRKGLDELFASLNEGDTLVVWKLDRLGRSTIHLLQLLDGLRKRNVDFQAITQGIDTTTSIGRMLYGQLAVFAEFEREQIRERTKAGMAAAKARGVHIGRPRKLTIRQIKCARCKITKNSYDINKLAVAYEVAPVTLSRALSLLNASRDSK